MNPLNSFLNQLNNQFLPMPQDQVNGNDFNPIAADISEPLFRKLEKEEVSTWGNYGYIDIPHIVLETKISSIEKKVEN